MHVAPLVLLLAVVPAQRKVVQPGPAATQSIPVATPTAPGNLAANDVQTLKAAHLEATDAVLLNFFRKRVPPGPDKERIAALVKQLGDPTPTTRAQAAAELVSLGPVAVPQLRLAANSPDDADAAGRARDCLGQVEGGRAADLVSAAARTLGLRKPVGAAEVLLAYLPFADNARVQEEIEEALFAVAKTGGALDAALTAAVKDIDPARRAAVARVLCKLGPSHHETVRPLLKDPKPNVRLQAALSLAAADDGQAVPVLIDALADLPPAQARQAEEFLTSLAGDWAVTAPLGDDAVARRVRRDVWRAWWNSLDGPALLEAVRSRALPDDEREHIAGLMKNLVDGSAGESEQAAAELVEFGSKAVPFLRRAADGDDRKLASAAAKVLPLAEKDGSAPLPAVAPHLLALRRPEGAAAALLAYLPSADNEELADAARQALAAVAFREGKPDAAVVKALTDKAAARRAAAAEALAQAAGDHLAEVRALLKDADAEVRLRVGLALAGRQEKDAVPVLIALLNTAPLDLARQAEDYLAFVAGSKAPTAVVGDDNASRVEAQKAWNAWWKENADKVALLRPERGHGSLGYTLFVESYVAVAGRANVGRLTETDATGKVRWQIEGLMAPQDAQVLPGGRVLVAEVNRSMVSERDLKGKVLWERQAPAVFAVQRLRNGNTFVACRNQLLEFDRDGKQVWSHHRPEYVMAARKFRDGQIALVSNVGNYVRLDATGKEAKSFRVPQQPNFGIGNVEVLPGDRVLCSVPGLNKVTEYNADGKAVWETNLPFPGIPSLLANGHTLLTSNSNSHVVELDRNGKIVSEMKDFPYRPWRVYRR
jgi:outer membrane protein assembly factor BamB/HEAT repeat protein